MQNIIVRHVSGSKAGQVEQFRLGDFDEITLGRDLSSSVKYDSTIDSQVGRLHAKITRESAASDQFCLTDLTSRNGTFVNRQQIHGTVRIRQGDLIQFGPAGPSFQFDTEPQVETLTKDPGRITLDAFSPLPTLGPPPQAVVESKAPDHSSLTISEPPSIPVGRRTIEMYLAKSQKESRRSLLVVVGVFVTIIAVLVGLLLYQGGYFKQQLASDAGHNPADKAAHKGDVAAKAAADAIAAAEIAEAETDPERTAWRIPVKPFQVLGSGHPGKAASDFDKPDGLIFTPAGLLLATDAKNRRVQIWNALTGARLGEFGHRVLGGEIVDIAVAPDGTVLITDQTLNLAYAFVPPKPGELDEKGKALGPYDYQFKGTRFGEQGFDKLGGIAFDSRGRVFAVDAHLNDVKRFNPDYTLDKSWHFEGTKTGGDTYLHGCEGIAIDESTGNLYIASEKDAVVQVFDWETGAYKHQLIGANRDASGVPSGKSIFVGSVEGLALAQHHLLAVDESAGHIQIFDLSRPDATNTDLVKYTSSLPGRSSGYKGFFGHTPLVNFEDKNDIALQTQVKEGTIIPGQANPPGYFCSPDAIASYTDSATGETYIAIADQCNYRLVIYRWADISRAITSVSGVAGSPDTTATVNPGGNPNLLPTGTPPAKVTTPAKVTPPRATPARRKPASVRPVSRERRKVLPKASDSKAKESKEQAGKKKKKQKY